MKKLRVLHLTNAYPYEEVPEYGIFIKEQIDSLSSESILNKVFFINGRKFGKMAYISAILELRKEIDNFDIIHCHHAYSFIIAYLAGIVGKKPLILSYLNDWTREVKDIPFGWLREIICKFTIMKSTFVIFKSPIPDQLKENKKVINLPNGVNSEFFKIQDRSIAKKSLGLNKDTIYILFVSSKNKYREQKRYDIFSNTLEIIKLQNVNKKIEEFCMVGQPRNLVPTIFAACDIHLLTSDYEGSPNSVKESLCCGTPVVTRNVGNVGDMLAGVNGTKIVNSNSPVELANSVTELLKKSIDPTEIRDSFLKKGITKDEIANKLSQLYSDVSPE